MSSGLQSGLNSYFAKPRKTNGATANYSFDGHTQMDNDMFFSPRVCDTLDVDGYSRMPHAHGYNTQVPVDDISARLDSQELWTRTSRPGGGGRQRMDAQRFRRAPMLDKSEECPVPTHTLQSRMSLSSYKAAQLRTHDKSRIDKSVDKTPFAFKKRYSGYPGQDWVDHLNKLEVLRAKKFSWTAKEFYYGLQHTLSGKASEVLASMEEDLVSVDLGAMLPSWYEANTAEYKLISARQTTFSQLTSRTKLAILICYFHDRFENMTVEQAADNFRYATQRPEESLEEWGHRIKLLKAKLEKYGRVVPWETYIRKWRYGTRSNEFKKALREARIPSDYNRAPIVYDYLSFEAWYKRRLKIYRDLERDKQEGLRLTLMDRFRSMVESKQVGKQHHVGRPSLPKKSSSKEGKDQSLLRSSKGDRSGPAPLVTRNDHSRLFRNQPSQRDLSKVVCYNCGEMGHMAKDCSQPKRPRTMRKNISTKIQGMMAEILSDLGEDNDGGNWDEEITALVSTIQLPETEGDSSKLATEGDSESEDLEEHFTTPAPKDRSREQSPALEGEKEAIVQASEAQLLMAEEDHTSTGDEYSYENFILTGYHSAIDQTDPLASDLQEHFLVGEDCFYHDWPTEFAVLTRHVARRLILVASKVIGAKGLTMGKLSVDELNWMVLQSSWVSIYTKSPAQIVLCELIERYVEAVSKRAKVGEFLVEVIREMLASMTETTAISAVALYPAMSKVLQAMLRDQFRDQVLERVLR